MQLMLFAVSLRKSARSAGDNAVLSARNYKNDKRDVL